MKLVLATNNMGKVREFARILEPLGISLLTQQQAGVQVQPEENGTTFAENARIKAMAVYQAGCASTRLTVSRGSTLPATTARIPRTPKKTATSFRSWKGCRRKNAPPALWHTSPVCFLPSRFSTAKGSVKAPSAWLPQEKADLATIPSFM